MRTIWKFALLVGPDKFDIQLPVGAKLLHVAVQNGHPQAWYEVDDSAPTERARVVVFSTGHPVVGAGRFIGTAVLHSGDLVLHYYEAVRQ